jgi:predicted HTH transcriptional regulator
MTHYEISVAKKVAKFIKSNKKITNNDLRALMMQEHSIHLSQIQMRRIINYLRTEGIVKNLAADWEGYWIEKDQLKVMKYIKSLELRAKSIMQVATKMRKAL